MFWFIVCCFEDFNVIVSFLVGSRTSGNTALKPVEVLGIKFVQCVACKSLMMKQTAQFTVNTVVGKSLKVEGPAIELHVLHSGKLDRGQRLV